MLKLKRSEIARPGAEQEIDDFFASKFHEIMGPMAALHALKRMQAEAGADGALIDGDRHAILDRAADQDAKVAALDRRRRDWKARIRAAATEREIEDLMKEFRNGNG
jgi:hypothetical protein